MQAHIQEMHGETFREGMILLPGGILELVWLEDEGTRAGQMLHADITADAAAYLFTPVRLDAGLRLGDVFQLLVANRGLVDIFRRDSAASLLTEVFGGEAPPYSGAYDPLGIEYLELSLDWRIEIRKRTQKGRTDVVRHEICGYLPRLDFNGVGYPLRDKDAARHGRTAGERIRWGIDLVPPRMLMHTPLRLNRTVTVYEHIQHSLKRHENLTHAFEYRADYPLGQVIHSILWELSVFGDKNGRAAARQLLSERMVELKAARTLPEAPGMR
jgi:hypothetical protein